MAYDLNDFDDPEVEELKAEARAQRAFPHLLRQHPDCRDPDHPGCEKCEGEDTMSEPIRIIIDIQGGLLQAVYGDRLPEGIEVEFILRDRDDIYDGDPDPMGKDYEPDVHYW